MGNDIAEAFGFSDEKGMEAPGYDDGIEGGTAPGTGEGTGPDGGDTGSSSEEGAPDAPDQSSETQDGHGDGRMRGGLITRRAYPNIQHNTLRRGLASR